MATTVDEHIVKIVQQVTGYAAAHKALLAVEERIKAEEDALKGMEDALTSAKTKLAEMMEGAGKGSVNLAAIDKQRAAIAALEQQIGASKAGLDRLNEFKPQAAGIDARIAAQKKADEADKARAAADKKAKADKREWDQAMKDAAAEAEKRRKEAAAAKAADDAKAQAAAQKNIESLGGIGSKMQALSKLGTAGILLAVAVALVAVAAAAALATAAFIRYGIAAADAARSQRLFDNAAAGSVARGSELNKVVSDIASRVPIAREQVAEFGRQLQLAGINGLRLQTALTTIAMIESVVPGAGAKIEGLVERFQKLRRAVLTRADLEGTGLALVDVAAQLAKGMGITTAAALQMLQNGTAGTDKVLDAMKRAVEQKFGKTIAAQMMSLTTQWAKLKESIGALFTGIDLEPLLGALKSITDSFSQNTVTGKVLKFLITTMFQGLVDVAAKVLPLVRAFFLQLVIAGLKLYIALKPIGAAISEAFDRVDGAKALEYAMIAGKVAAVALLFVLGAITAVVLAAMAPILLVGSILYGAFKMGEAAVQGVIAMFGGLGGSLSSLGSVGAGAASGLVDGFVAGVQAKIGAAIGAVAQLGAAIEQGLRTAIGWHSPATLGIDAIAAVGEGMEVGAEKTAPTATGAAAGLVDASAVKGAAKGAKAAGKIIWVDKLYVGSREDFTELRAMLGGEFEFQGAT